VYGLGGIGKTQIALEMAYWTREKYSECSVFWIQATHAESIQQAFKDIGMRLNVPGIEMEQADAKKLVQRHLSQEPAGQWLLIVDNVDDMDIWDNELKAYLPQSQQGSIVCTTRNRKVAIKIAGPDAIKVPQMDEEIAMQLLSKLLLDKELLTSHQNARELLERLTFLPLALVQAAAYINANGIALSDYLSLLDEQEEDIINLLSEDFDDDWRYRDAKNPVATTWLISFKHIKRFDPLAAEYMSFMACVDPKDIPIALLPPERSQKKKTEAIGTLDAYAFVSRHVANRGLDVHRLVHLAMRNWLRGESLLSEWATKAMKRLEEVFPDDDHKNRSIWRLYITHARYMLERDDVKGKIQEREELVWKLALCLHSDGRYNEAEKLFLEANETSERVLGLEHPRTLASLSHLASIYGAQGKWNGARELQERVTEMCERVLGPKNLNTSAVMGNLAWTYRNLGRWKEAEQLGVRVITARNRALGLEHPATLTSIGNLAATYCSQGRWKEAEELEVQVMETRKRVFGPEHPDTLVSINNLASTYCAQGRWKEAEELAVRVMELKERMLGPEHPLTLVSINNVAGVYCSQGRWKDAGELGVQVVETKKRVLGPEHPDTLISMNNLAIFYCKQGRWKEAEELELQVLEAKQRVLGPEHPLTLISMGNLPTMLKGQGRDEEAIFGLKTFLQLGTRILGPRHPGILSKLEVLDEWQESIETGR
jgi:tetratricopeptide (TPR) repeat protein